MKHYFGGIYYRMDRDHIFLFAGGLAFSLFLCIIPFVLILFWILGNFLSSESVALQVNTFLDTVIPYKTYADYARTIIFKRIDEVIAYKNLAGFIGFIGLFIAASGFFSSLRTILNKIFGAEKELNMLVGFVRDFVIILISILLFFVLTLSFPFIDYIRSLPQEYEMFSFFDLAIFQQVFTTIFSIVVLFSLFSLIYKFIPTVKIRKRSVAVGAIWAAFLWEGAKQLFGFYIRNFPTLGMIYGTYILVIVLAFWIYYSAIVFILGAEIGKLFDERLNAAIDKRENRKRQLAQSVANNK
ncbi:MAG TPA: YihY/virulence factor BrkB family protein [Ignavibacteriaceae bacterium]|nr:YihY/virulence factor BrkB family protein [Ignavibacteriaceae bacterium]